MAGRDTIFALATPAAASPAALIRVSGPRCADLAAALGTVLRRGASMAELPDGGPALLITLPAPGSYTGEDTLELMLPGNPWLVAQTQDWLAMQGCRRAEAGEFTRRALQNGRISLAQAQGVLGLIQAQDDTSRRNALADLRGDAARDLRVMADQLRALSARFEMLFDFSEEEHAESQEGDLYADLRALTIALQAFSGAPPRPARGEPVIALFGPPNAGKSTLYNALIGRPRALVSPLPGTTRDAVESPVVIDGCTARLVDLSGVGALDADHGRFAEAARERALQADVLLLLCGPGQQAELQREFETLVLRDADLPARSVRVHTMSDLAPVEGTLAISAVSGGGMEALRAELRARLARAVLGDSASLVRENAREAAAVLHACDPDAPPEATAREVRHALALLDAALLHDAPGDVLGLIFSRFCIGK